MNFLSNAKPAPNTDEHLFVKFFEALNSQRSNRFLPASVIDKSAKYRRISSSCWSLIDLPLASNCLIGTGLLRPRTSPPYSPQCARTRTTGPWQNCLPLPNSTPWRCEVPGAVITFFLTPRSKTCCLCRPTGPSRPFTSSALWRLLTRFRSKP